MWRLDDICAACADGLRAEAERLDHEQSPYGLDARDELALHPLVRAGLARAGLGVHAEQRYPGHRARARRSEGDRCDIVLTERPGQHLLDPLAAGTLFGDRGVEAGEALWVEVKAVHQFAIAPTGAAGPNPGYGALLLGPAMADVRKLASEGAIARAALLLVMFCADEATARHDLAAWMHRCLDKGLPVQSPATEVFAVTDRIGNGVCLVALVGVRP